jgi:signal transduction histidine kinase/CheY-like chemotaxis protein/HPt (histidine-containing phosphotransfer) domain-containing protein
MERLVAVLARARQAAYDTTVTRVDVGHDGGAGTRLEEEINLLLAHCGELLNRNRRVKSRLLSDVDVLAESLGRISLGEFDTPVGAVYLPELETLRIGVEDMTRRLQASNAQLEATIEALRQREAELHREREIAEAATREKSAFLANMSHEIRTPLNAILGLSTLALAGDMNPWQRGYLRKIESSGKVLLSLVNDVLDSSKIEAGKLELDSGDLRVREVVENISDMFSTSVTAKDVEFVTFVGHDVPPLVEGDAVRLGQVLINLVSNAVKFTEQGDIVLSVELLGQVGDRVRLRFSVRDSGIGIDAVTLPRLFQSFTQADNSTTRKYGGTGLGLAICKALVELMHGTIEVESTPGKGSTFSFMAEFGLPEGDRMDGRLDMPAALRGCRVLIVEDHPLSRMVLREYVAGFGLEADETSDGETALERVRTAPEDRPYDLILMAWRLPGIDGIETALRIKRDLRRRQLPVVLITPFGSEDVWRQATEVGVAAFVIKPIKESQLFDTILEATRQRTGREVDDLALAFPDATTLSRLAGAHVLLVEDNAINQEVATELLEHVGVRVDIAGNGLDALRRLATCDYAAVLMDVQMPLMDGITAVRAIRAGRWVPPDEGEPVIIPRERQRLPVIAMTAASLKGEREKCLSAGMDDYVKKPIDVAELYRVLGRYLAARAAGSPPPVEPAQDRTAPAEADRQGLPDALPGLDVAQGLARIGGNHVLYVKLLSDLVRDHAAAVAEIEGLMAAGDWDGARRAAHTLKGIAATLGLVWVARAAAAVEELVEGRQERRLPAALERLEREMGPALASVRSLAGEDKVAALPSVASRPLSVDRKHATEILARLDLELSQHNLRAAQTVETLRVLLPASHAAIGDIDAAVRHLDFDRAREVLAGVMAGADVSIGGAG